MRTNNAYKKVINLYRYLRFDRDRLAEILVHSKLYGYSPKLLNDPFDSEIQFTFEGCTDDDFRFYFRDVISKKEPKLKSNEINERVEAMINTGYHRNPGYQAKIRDTAKNTLQTDIDNYGLICLTEKPDDIVMWSHYGDCHKGICLEFDKQLLDKHFICRKVKYSKSYHRFSEFYRKFVKATQNAVTDSHRNEATEALGKYILCKKAKHWNYECEWRILIPWQQIKHRGGNRYFSYSESMLTGIILGLNTNEAQQKVIENMISHRSVKPKLFKAYKNNDDFKINIEELNS